MSNVRVSVGNISQDQAIRLAKHEENNKHYADTVVGSIYQSIPQRVLGKEVAEADPSIFNFLPNVISNFVERVSNYTNYNGMGFNAEGIQTLAFTYKKGGNKPPRRYFGPGVDEGPIFNAIMSNGKAVWKDGHPLLEEEPFGTWKLDRAKVAEKELHRSKDHFFVELNGAMVEIGKNKVIGLKTGEPYCFAIDINPMEVDPSTRIPVMVELDEWTEDAQIIQVKDRFFAYRNLVGRLHLESNEGHKGSWPLLNIEPKSVLAKRKRYTKQIEEWEAMTSSERRQAREDKSYKVPKLSAGAEAFLANEEAILNGKNDYFIEVKKDKDGNWIQFRK